MKRFTALVAMSVVASACQATGQLTSGAGIDFYSTAANPIGPEPGVPSPLPSPSASSNPISSVSANSYSTGITTSDQFPAPFTPQRIVTVCASGCNYTLLSQALMNAEDYDLIQVQAGTYNDCSEFGVAHVWIQGVGGMPHFENSVCGSKAILIPDGQSVTIDNIEFSNYSISADLGNNAAGIRDQAYSLTVRNCYFHDGQEGILTDAAPTSNDLTILNSHFARHGADGYEHDIYINHVNSFVIQNSLLEQAYLGNVLKTRALTSYIQCNQLQNGYDSAYAKSGYVVDLPNGGAESVDYNLISQGIYNGGQTIIAEFGAEGLVNPTQSLEMTGNTFLNDLGSGVFLNMFAAPSSNAILTSNLFVGGGTTIGGSAAASVTSSGSGTFANRSAAGLSSQFPMPAICQGTIGNVPVQ